MLIFLSLDRRKVIHFNVTDAPSAYWTSLQLLQAFPFDTAPRFIIRDRDSIYGAVVKATIRQIGSAQKVISRRSPWQNGYCERMVGTGFLVGTGLEPPSSSLRPPRPVS